MRPSKSHPDHRLRDVLRTLTDDTDEDEDDAGDGSEDGGAAGVVNDPLRLHVLGLARIRHVQLSFGLCHDCCSALEPLT